MATNPPVIPRLQVRAGLRAELVAGSALVESPAGMAFDERGRLFVAELRDYPSSRSGATLTGRVRLLEDSDGDGRFDTSVVFADDLERPTGIACSRGGVFVAGPSELIFLLDQDGDDRADLRRTLLRFNVPPSAESPDPFLFTMTWGPDRRIYTVLPSAEAMVLNANAPDREPLQLVGGGFSFDPLTLQLRAESGDGATGQAFGHEGRRFLTTSATALSVAVLTASEANRNPYTPVPPTAATLIPAGQSATPLTCLVYCGRRYPTNLHGNAFLADPGSSTVYRARLRAGSTHPIAASNEGGVLQPLVTSPSSGFRPMQLAVGPDDCVYVADLSREVYPGGKPVSEDPDADEAISSGRIWRLVPAASSTEEIALPEFSETASLVGALGASNAWIRATAARLLLERPATNSAHALRRVLDYSTRPDARLEALRSLEAQGAATLRDLGHGLNDKDASLRLAAIHMAADRVVNGRMANSLWNSLRMRSADRSGEVRLHAALALAGVKTPYTGTVLADVYLRDRTDVWMQRAMLTAHTDSLSPVFNRLVREPGVRQSPTGRELLRDLATSVGLGGGLGDVSDCLGTLGDLEIAADQTLALITALAEGLEGRGLRLSEADESGNWLAIANSAQTIAVEGNNEHTRAQAVRVMGACLGPDFVADEYLLLMFAPGLPVPMQIPVIQALARQGLDRDFNALTQRWHLWDAPEQLATLDALLQSENGTRALLTALADKTIPVAGLTSVHINLLREHPVNGIRARAVRLLGPAQPNRDELVSGFIEALDLNGSTARGRELFRARCSYCHRTGSSSFGPPPAEMRKLSSLQLVAGIVDPSREIASGYGTAVLGSSNDRTVWGVVREPNADVIQLITPEGTRRYLRGNLRHTEWSLMPDNTAAGLTRQDVADLVEFVRNSDQVR